MRLHICWGNYEGPHSHELPLLKIIDIAFKARVQAISIEAANPRHDHEWEDLKTIKIPDDKILIPGVINSTTNFVEHPRLVAQRLLRYATVIDREQLIAGVDCGFGTAVRSEPTVADSIVWAKLAALAEGAKLAIASDSYGAARRNESTTFSFSCINDASTLNREAGDATGDHRQRSIVAIIPRCSYGPRAEQYAKRASTSSNGSKSSTDTTRYAGETKKNSSGSASPALSSSVCSRAGRRAARLNWLLNNRPKR